MIKKPHAPPLGDNPQGLFKGTLGGCRLLDPLGDPGGILLGTPWGCIGGSPTGWDHLGNPLGDPLGYLLEDAWEGPGEDPAVNTLGTWGKPDGARVLRLPGFPMVVVGFLLGFWVDPRSTPGRFWADSGTILFQLWVDLVRFGVPSAAD